MARLLVLAACFAGSWATYMKDNYSAGAGDISGSYGGGDYNVHKSGGNKETIEFSIHVISESKGGAEVQNIAAPMKPPGMKHTVVVGGVAGKVYTPDTIMAEIGDMVEFQFMSMNHTVTQSTFPLPCVKMELGKDSGFKPNPKDAMSPPPSWTFQVMTKSPIWFYCRQKGHCGSGMTFSINPTMEKSQAIFKQMAIEQNGTASGAPPASPPPYGGAGAAAPPAPTEIPVIVPPAPSANNNASPPPAAPPVASTPPPAAAEPGSMTTGSGGAGSGACECSCFCGIAAFPPGAGIGMWGGMSGAVPA